MLIMEYYEPTLLQRALPGGRRSLAVGCAVLLLAAAVGAYTWIRNRSTRIGAIAVLPLDIQSNEPEAGYIFRYEDLLHRVKLLPPREVRKRGG